MKINLKIKEKIEYILKKEGPVSIRLYPMGYLCNHNCPMCWRSRLSDNSKMFLAKKESDNLTIEEYRKIIRDLPSAVKHIDVVGGGEPLLYSKIGNLFDLIKTKKVVARLITNGALMNLGVIDNLIRCNWDEVRISFHAGSKKTYQKVNGVDDYDEVVKNIKDLALARKKGVGPKIAMLFVIQRDNVNEIKSFVSLAESLGVDEVEFDYVFPENQRVIPEKEQREKIVKSMKEVLKDTKINNNSEWVLKMLRVHPKWGGRGGKNYFADKYCSNVQSNLDIGSDGTTIPCCLMPFDGVKASVKKRTVVEVWRDYRLFREEMLKGEFKDFCYELCNYDLPKRV